MRSRSLDTLTSATTRLAGSVGPTFIQREYERDADEEDYESAKEALDSRLPLAPPENVHRTGRLLAEDTIKAYFESCESARSQSKKSIGFDGLSSSDGSKQASRVWQILSHARVFVVDPIQYAMLYRMADEAICSLAGIGWDEANLEQSEYQKYVDVCHEEGQKMPFPDPMPFECVFIGYGKQLALTQGQAEMRISLGTIKKFNITHVELLGHVLGVHSGECNQTPGIREAYAVLHIKGSGYDGIGFIGTFSSTEGTEPWAQTFNLDPWVLTMLIQSINEQNPEKQSPSLGMKMIRKSAQKRASGNLPPPAPYYVVENRSTVRPVIPPAPKEIPEEHSIDWSHRWDVRGHYCIRVVRGAKPIDTTQLIKLQNRGYKIYEESRLIPQEEIEILESRKIPTNRDDEWIAILISWRDSYVKGPSEKPYVPAARLLGEKEKP